MRLSQPRIPPLTETEWTEEQRKVLEPFYKEGQTYNVVGTLARHWEAFQKFLVWGRHVVGDTSTLPPRERELLILRTGWLCRSEYEWGQHVIMGKKAGLTDAEIARIKEGPGAAGWAPFDATLLHAADELHADAVIGDKTWAALSERYQTQQLMDVVFTVGQYHLVSMSLNTFGVQLDKGVKGF
ncbi:MAG: carboxymuconolactone decarboxylase family protein [Deltaproteobacteria bacterium]|nr:carboxymuconolactone decarboxylase family protein [Deltaproteobacteria bacterium]